MSLNKQYIQRIDSFLERLGCEYVDIRYEMVDHLASEIEEKVTNYDAFFKKNKMRGQFLGFMLSKKKELENSYYKQSKKQFWTNFVYIFKLIAKELLNVKVLLFIILTILSVKYLSQWSEYYTAIVTLIIASITSVYFFFIQNKEVKKYGKLRLLYTFYWLVYFPLLTMNPIYRFSVLLKHENDDFNNVLVFYYTFIIIFNILLTIVFLKDRTRFRTKYKNLLKVI